MVICVSENRIKLYEKLNGKRIGLKILIDSITSSLSNQ